ncbi:MAG: SNF2-related protein [Verrucomicrobiota bacterium]
MSNPVALSRKFLSDAGGWKEMKEARMLHSAGRVEEASYANGVLEGLVRDKGKTFKVRMEIRSRTDLENHCPCYRARRDGIICCHALAVGLEVLEPTEKPKVETAGKAGSDANKSARLELSKDWPPFTESASDDAVPARLALVLPPNLGEAWRKGRVSIGVELEREGERKLLKTVSSNDLLFLDTADAALYRALQQISPAAVPGMLSASTEDLARLFAAAPGHERITLGRRTPLRLSFLPYRPRVIRTRALHFRVDWPAEVEPLPSSRGIWALTEADLVQPVAPGLRSDWMPLLVAGLSVPPEQFPDFEEALLANFEADKLEIDRPTAEIQLDLEGSLNHLDAHLRFAYGERAVPAATDRPLVEEIDGRLVLSDRETEERTIGELEEFGFDRRGSEGRWVLKDKEKILQFLAHGYRRFREGRNVETGERFEHALAQVEPVETKFDFRSSGEDWFALEVGFGTISEKTIPRQEIERLLQMGQTSKSLSNGRIAVLNNSVAHDLSEIVTDCDPEQLAPGTYRIDSSHAGYLRATAEDLGFGVEGKVPWQNAEEGIEFYDLSALLSSTLRPYQEEGFRWLQAQASRGMGGILADDMGLGKTLQTLAFLYSVGGTSLVVCPSSIVFNWVAEAAKFTPDLKVVAIEGANREKTLAANEDADLFVTSYALLRRDEKTWTSREFDVVILDEAQHIKNPEARVSQVAHRLRGTWRFALTGTPIENSVRDLWSIGQFALPGYLGHRQDFAERFEKPLSSSEPPEGTKERLSRRLRPVVLRRLKSEVAKDLPEKIEQVVYCDLKPKQREVYDRLLRESKTALVQAEGGKQRMLALTALLRLRQTCCDLRLLGLPEVEDEEASVKAAALGELLDNAIEGGHRVLVFSQFVEMLQVLVPELAAKQIDFCYLDGQTKNRGEVVKKFQEGDAPVFLISLKAGGVGLNLTAADTVIHIDPWWNPAIEAQATDRAHRIGQTKVVTSYKLITRGTVEEKILSLQNRKRAMTESLLSEAGDAGLSEAELMSLLK